AYESGYFTVKLIKIATQNFNPANRICELVRLYKDMPWNSKWSCFPTSQGRIKIVHRDIRLCNIFLDKFLDPKISYLGLAKHFGADDTHCSTSRIMGAREYMAPQYLMHGSTTEKVDVFSFGVSILVLSTQKKKCDIERNDDDWLRNDLIFEQFSERNTMLLDLAILCTNDDPRLRPTMSEVVSILQGKITMKTPLPVDPPYVTTVFCKEYISEIEIASSSSSYTKLTRGGFVYKTGKVKENNTRPEFHNDFVSDLKASSSEGGEEINKPYETTSFSLRYIEVATTNFSPANKIGQGSSGSVYKGMVPNGKMIAVKQLSLKSDQGKVEFLNEVNTIFTLRHPNIIRLLGHCPENNQHLLVYEYMENGRLNRALFGPGNLKNKLSWPARLRICTGIAKGLMYLHAGNSKMKIVHRDIKLSNILLDKDLNPKISDFGLIMHYNRELTHIKTGLAGTVGYMAPEYVIRGTVTEKIDIYSFGVACDLQQKGDPLGLFDQDVRMNIPVKEADMVLNLAILCTNYDLKLRPTMSEVVDILAVLCSNSNCTARIDYRTNITDISSHNLSMFDYIDGAATGSSSNGVPAVDVFNKDIELHRDFVSNVNVSAGEVRKSDMPLSQVTITSAEPLGLNAKPQTSSISKDTYNQKGVQSKLEYIEPFFEEGKLHIEFSAEEFRAVCDECENSLVGCFVDEDVPFNMDLKIVEKLWKVKGDFSVFTIENGYFVFQFSCVEEKMRVLKSADLWRIRQRQLILKEWDWKLMVERIDMISLPIWVKIYNLPLFFWIPSVLNKVGSGLGTPLYVDKRTQNKQQLAYAMLCIEFDANKPLPETLHILVKGMECHLNLEYDWSPLRCENCCTFGHIDLSCRRKMKPKGNHSVASKPIDQMTKNLIDGQEKKQRWIVRRYPRAGLKKERKARRSPTKTGEIANFRPLPAKL
ncbi:hypothetical protein MKX01_020806, partial [Papaver californicum]